MHVWYHTYTSVLPEVCKTMCVCVCMYNVSARQAKVLYSTYISTLPYSSESRPPIRSSVSPLWEWGTWGMCGRSEGSPSRKFHPRMPSSAHPVAFLVYPAHNDVKIQHQKIRKKPRLVWKVSRDNSRQWTTNHLKHFNHSHVFLLDKTKHAIVTVFPYYSSVNFKGAIHCFEDR